MSRKVVNPYAILRGLPRDVWIVCGATFANRAGTMAMPFLVLYGTQHLGFTAEQAGFTFALFGAGTLLSAPLGGWLSDRLGARHVLKAALAGGGTVLLVYGLFQRPLPVYAMTFLWATIGEMGRPASMAVVTEMVSQAQRRQAIAAYRLAINLGMSIGPTVGGFIAAWSFPALFLINGVTGLAAGLWLLVALPHRPPAPAVPTPGAEPLPAFWRDRAMLLFLVGFALVWTVFDLQLGPLSLFVVEDLGRTTRFYGLLSAVNTLLIVLFEVPVTGWTRSWSYRRGLFTGGALIGAGMGMLALGGWSSAVLGVAVAAFGEMLLMTAAAPFVVELAPPGRSGAYLGAYSLAVGAAVTLGPWVGTVVLVRHGAEVLWLGAAAVGLFGALLTARAASR